MGGLYIKQENLETVLDGKGAKSTFIRSSYRNHSQIFIQNHLLTHVKPTPSPRKIWNLLIWNPHRLHIHGTKVSWPNLQLINIKGLIMKPDSSKMIFVQMKWNRMVMNESQTTKIVFASIFRFLFELFEFSNWIKTVLTSNNFILQVFVRQVQSIHGRMPVQIPVKIPTN